MTSSNEFEAATFEATAHWRCGALGQYFRSGSRGFADLCPRAL